MHKKLAIFPTQTVKLKTQSPLDSRPWEYRILAGVSAETVKAFTLDVIKDRIEQQFVYINQQFNKPEIAQDMIKFILNVDDIYVFDGDPNQESLNKEHFNHEFLVVYDAFPKQGGGWYNSNHSIYHSWPTKNSGSLFDSYATNGLVHEFGHAIGSALDLYALNVDADKNPINHTKYYSPESFMNYPYGQQIWDRHTIYFINRSNGFVVDAINRDAFTDKEFPASLGIKVIQSNGSPAGNSKISLYPVEWYSYTVSGSPAYSLVTDAQGEAVFGDNPFGPFTSGKAWGLKYPNFLVEAQLADGTKLYQWMPVDQVQVYHFDHPNQPYRLTIDKH